MNRVFRAAVGAFIFNKESELLVILKHNYIDRWDIVKGGINLGGEDIYTALKRELNEELGTINFKILKESAIPKVFIKPDLSWQSLDLNEYIGQAQINFWVFIDKCEVLKVPNEEIEKYKWIKIKKEEIKKYFNIHDSTGTYQEFLPIEWLKIKDELFKSL